jgi:hypothetical protein
MRDTLGTAAASGRFYREVKENNTPHSFANILHVEHVVVKT